MAVEMFLRGYAEDLREIGREIEKIDFVRGVMTFTNPRAGSRTTLRAKSVGGKLVISERMEVS